MQSLEQFKKPLASEEILEAFVYLSGDGLAVWSIVVRVYSLSNLGLHRVSSQRCV